MAEDPRLRFRRANSSATQQQSSTPATARVPGSNTSTSHGAATPGAQVNPNANPQFETQNAHANTWNNNNNNNIYFDSQNAHESRKLNPAGSQVGDQKLPYFLQSPQNSSQPPPRRALNSVYAQFLEPIEPEPIPQMGGISALPSRIDASLSGLHQVDTPHNHGRPASLPAQRNDVMQYNQEHHSSGRSGANIVDQLRSLANNQGQMSVAPAEQYGSQLPVQSFHQHGQQATAQQSASQQLHQQNQASYNHNSQQHYQHPSLNQNHQQNRPNTPAHLHQNQNNHSNVQQQQQQQQPQQQHQQNQAFNQNQSQMFNDMINIQSQSYNHVNNRNQIISNASTKSPSPRTDAKQDMATYNSSRTIDLQPATGTTLQLPLSTSAIVSEQTQKQQSSLDINNPASMLAMVMASPQFRTLTSSSSNSGNVIFDLERGMQIARDSGNIELEIFARETINLMRQIAPELNSRENQQALTHFPTPNVVSNLEETINANQQSKPPPTSSAEPSVSKTTATPAATANKSAGTVAQSSPSQKTSKSETETDTFAVESLNLLYNLTEGIKPISRTITHVKETQVSHSKILSALATRLSHIEGKIDRILNYLNLGLRAPSNNNSNNNINNNNNNNGGPSAVTNASSSGSASGANQHHFHHHHSHHHLQENFNDESMRRVGDDNLPLSIASGSSISTPSGGTGSKRRRRNESLGNNNSGLNNASLAASSSGNNSSNAINANQNMPGSTNSSLSSSMSASTDHPCHNCASSAHSTANCIREPRICRSCGEVGHIQQFCQILFRNSAENYERRNNYASNATAQSQSGGLESSRSIDDVYQAYVSRQAQGQSMEKVSSLLAPRGGPLAAMQALKLGSGAFLTISPKVVKETMPPQPKVSDDECEPGEIFEDGELPQTSSTSSPRSISVSSESPQQNNSESIGSSAAGSSDNLKFNDGSNDNDRTQEAHAESLQASIDNSLPNDEAMYDQIDEFGNDPQDNSYPLAIDLEEKSLNNNLENAQCWAPGSSDNELEPGTTAQDGPQESLQSQDDVLYLRREQE